MVPEVVLLADVGDCVEWIEGAEDRRARRGRHQERTSALGQAPDYLLFQVRYHHLSSARAARQQTAPTVVIVVVGILVQTLTRLSDRFQSLVNLGLLHYQ